MDPFDRGPTHGTSIFHMQSKVSCFCYPKTQESDKCYPKWNANCRFIFSFRFPNRKWFRFTLHDSLPPLKASSLIGSCIPRSKTCASVDLCFFGGTPHDCSSKTKNPCVHTIHSLPSPALSFPTFSLLTNSSPRPSLFIRSNFQIRR